MPEKDISEKILEDYEDVFADIVNVLLFNGKERVKPEELEAGNTRAVFKADGVVREGQRDVVKYWKKKNIRIACLGIENQTKADADMSLRVLQYDAAEYRAELDKKTRYPVITLVLYFGDKDWKRPKSVFERLKVPLFLKSFMNDYKINLFEIGKLSEKQNGKKGEYTMREAMLDRIEARGKAIGEAIGEAKGFDRGLSQGSYKSYIYLINKGALSKQMAIDALKAQNIPVDGFEEMYRKEFGDEKMKF